MGCFWVTTLLLVSKVKKRCFWDQQKCHNSKTARFSISSPIVNQFFFGFKVLNRLLQTVTYIPINTVCLIHFFCVSKLWIFGWKQEHVIPNSCQVTPDTFQVIPNSCQITPDSFRSIPDSCRVIPFHAISSRTHTKSSRSHA